jgi:acylpyruvate hydrolase
MRFAFCEYQNKPVSVVAVDGELRGLTAGEDGYPGTLTDLLHEGRESFAAAFGRLKQGRAFAENDLKFLPPLARPEKIICIGLNYADHSAEAGFQPPDYPTVFGRFASSLIGHNSSIERTALSDQLDYEGELVAVIGTAGHRIPKERALSHVAGYSIFNDASVRDYQTKSPQWTVGKNFDTTGAFGPYFVPSDALPPGATNLKLETRLNGQVVQSSNTSNMIFDVATLVSLMSDAMTLSIGDIIVAGTPAGVGAVRKPPLFMKPGDICEVEIEKLGTLRNPIVQERVRAAA